MRRIALAALTLCFVASHAAAASFDCARASRPVDKLICGDAALSRADEQLAAAYKAALAAKGSDQDRSALRGEQRGWIAQRDAGCMGGTAPVPCLKSAYAERLAALGEDHATVETASVTALNDAALTAAHPAERSEFGFPQGTFSPKGDLFAFAVSNIVSGDADQVWLYELANRKLVAATPSPVKEKTEYNIESFFFVGGTLYVQGTNGAVGGAQDPFKRAATMAGGRDVASVPAAPPVPGQARDTTSDAGDELSDQGDRREEDGHYAVTSKNQGHGALTLSAVAKGSGREWTIATGGWNLGSFAFDAPRARVVYADNAGKLAVTDLKSRATTTIPVAVDTLLDVTDDGRLAAYVANGACDPSQPRGRQQTICFVKLP